MKAAAQVIFEQAEEEFQRGHFAVALSLYTQYMLNWVAESDPAVNITERLTGIEMVAMERLTDLAALFGLWDKAANILNLSIKIFEQAGNLCASDYTRLKLASLELNRGFPRHALQQIKQMSSITVDPDAIEFTDRGFVQWEAGLHWTYIGAADRAVLLSRLYFELGRLEAATGEYQRALAALKRGLFHCRPGTPDLAQQTAAPLYMAIAWAELELGDLPSAEVALQGLPASVESSRQPGAATQRLEITGKIALLRGELGTAKREFEDALKICEEQQFERAAVLAKLNLAQVLIYVNQTREASDLLLSARETAIRHEDKALEVRSEAILRHANARAESLAESVMIADPIIKQWGAADEPDIARDEVMRQNPIDIAIAGDYLALFEERVLGFNWHLSRSDLGAASQYLEEITDDFKTTDSVLIRVRLLVLERMLDYYAGHYESAANGFQLASPLLEEMGLLPELWQVQRFISWCLTKSGRLREAELVRREAERTLTDLTESLSATDRVIFRLNKWSAEEEYITGEINRLVHLKAKTASSSWLRRFWMQWQLSKQVGVLLDYADRYKGSLIEREVKGQKTDSASSHKLPLWRRLLRIPRDQVTFSFLVLPDRVLIARIGWMSLEFGVSSLTRIQVRDYVRRWHKLMLQGDDVSAREAQRLMEALTERLQISRLLDTLPERVCHLTFVPDDSLHGLPFAAIRYRGKYLVESYALSVTFEWSSQCSSTAELGEMLAVAITSGTDEYRVLPNARKEVNSVQNRLSKRGISVTQLIDDQADKQTIMNLLPDVGLFHIACHGTFQPDRPDCSGLVLISHGNAEILSLRELCNLQLPKLEQAVLSACWSSDSFILPGRLVISLPETLWRAGGRSIVGCLWEVEDSFAGHFLSRFYDNLENMPRSEALRQAQLECIEHRLKGCETIDTSDPIYWAGFTLYGDSGSLVLKLS